MLNIQFDEFSGFRVWRPVGELDAFTVSYFRQTLAELASPPRLIIDLSSVSVADSAGLGALIGGVRRVRELGGNVSVSCNRPNIVRLLRTTGFDRIIAVTDNLAAAATALQPPASPR